jgi:endonuclease G
MKKPAAFFFPLMLVALLSCDLHPETQKTSADEPQKKEEYKQRDTSQTDTEIIDTDAKSNAQKIGLLEQPLLRTGEAIIAHYGYSLCYSEQHEQATWVAYELTASETNKRYERSDAFLTDPMVRSGSADDYDYKGSGFDRGHLAPAADMGWSSKAMSESFYYSNMSPQDPGFNRGIWKRLEEQVRSWASELGSVYVATGPVLKSGLPSIGSNRVTVPTHYYKVILYTNGKEARAIGFVLPNASSRASLSQYAVSIDQVERVTGLDFFPKLDDSIESSAEKSVCTTCWSWSVHKTKSYAPTSTSVQCSGITLKGLRCKRKTKSPNGRCYQHQ